MHLRKQFTGTDGSSTIDMPTLSQDAQYGLAALHDLLQTVRGNIAALQALSPDQQLSSLFVMKIETLRRHELHILYSIGQVRSKMNEVHQRAQRLSRSAVSLS